MTDPQTIQALAAANGNAESAPDDAEYKAYAIGQRYQTRVKIVETAAQSSFSLHYKDIQLIVYDRFGAEEEEYLSIIHPSLIVRLVGRHLHALEDLLHNEKLDRIEVFDATVHDPAPQDETVITEVHRLPISAFMQEEHTEQLA